MEQVDAHGQKITLVHYVFQVDPERVACMPNMEEFHSTPYHPAVHRTNDTRAVSCPQCRRTEQYKAARG